MHGRMPVREWVNRIPLYGMVGFIIISQNRHVMYNIGYLNGILRSLHLKKSDWWSYNEQ
ncbi:MAG: hypothetical protein Q4F05_12005 [bacterium]|nr:hypothetical protein [bacterium]